MANVYTCGRLGLGVAGTVYNLYTLMSAIDSQTPIRASEICFSADSGNVMSIMIGDRYLSSNRYGRELLPQISSGGMNAAIQFRGDVNKYTLKDINFMCLTQSQCVNVSIWTA